jgi:ubiquinone/menaquinone biosynthesis C-methylase UbiE
MKGMREHKWDPYRLLESPVLYNLKSAVFSMGRESVLNYLRRSVELPAGGRVLDAGCGTGRHARVFDASFWGIDGNAKYIDYARRHRRGVFSVMDATNLAFPGAFFDLVFCVGLLHHLSDPQARAAVREMRRVTRDSGRVLVIEGVFPSVTNFLGYLLFKCDRGRHTRTLAALKDLLAQEGFHLHAVCRGLTNCAENIPRSFPYRRAVFSNR